MQGTIPNGEAMACWGWTSSHHRLRQDNLVVQGYSVLLMDCFWPDFYPFSLEKVLQLLALKLLLSSVLKLCCILWKHHREVSLPLLSIGTTFFLLKSDIFHSDAGKRLILLEKGLNGNCSACGSSFVGLVSQQVLYRVNAYSGIIPLGLLKEVSSRAKPLIHIVIDVLRYLILLKSPLLRNCTDFLKVLSFNKFIHTVPSSVKIIWHQSPGLVLRIGEPVKLIFCFSFGGQQCKNLHRWHGGHFHFVFVLVKFYVSALLW